MVKVTGPAMSLDAQKTLRKTLTFQRRPSGHSVFKRTIPHDPYTINQIKHRAIIKEAVSKWHQLSTSEKQQWEDFLKS